MLFLGTVPGALSTGGSGLVSVILVGLLLLGLVGSFVCGVLEEWSAEVNWIGKFRGEEDWNWTVVPGKRC